MKKVIALTLAVSMAAALAACGQSAPTESAPAAVSSATSAAAASSQPATAAATAVSGSTDGRTPVTLFRADDGNGAVEALIKGFEASQDKYSVNWVVASNDTDQVRDQLNTAFLAGSGEYDLVCIDTVWAGDMAAAGYLEPLDSYMMSAGRKVSDYNKGSLQSGTYSAKTYGLPLFPDFGVLYFRKDIVSQEDADKLIGGNYSWDDLITMSEKYMGQGGTTSGLNFQANQYEGLICNANEWTANFTDVQNGLSEMKKAVDSKATPEDILVYQEDQSATGFLNGETVFSRNWPYVWGKLNDESVVKKDQVDVAPLPGGSCIGGWLIGMNANSKNKEGAWALLDYITSLDGQVIFSSTGGYVPGFNEALNNPDVLKANELLSKPGFKKALENTIARPSSDDYNKLSDALQISIHKYLSGESDLDTCVSEVNKLLGK